MGVEYHTHMLYGLSLRSDGTSSLLTSMQSLQTPDRNGRVHARRKDCALRLENTSSHNGDLGQWEGMHTYLSPVSSQNKENYIPNASRVGLLPLFPLLHSYILHSSIACYNRRLLHSDLTQVQSGMLLVCNGICSSKFHRALPAASNAFLELLLLFLSITSY